MNVEGLEEVKGKCSFCYRNDFVVFQEPSVWIYGKQLKMCSDCYNFFYNKKYKFTCKTCKQPFIPRFQNCKICLDCWKEKQEQEKQKGVKENAPTN